jgi:hypothetical protein
VEEEEGGEVAEGQAGTTGTGLSGTEQTGTSRGEEAVTCPSYQGPTHITLLGLVHWHRGMERQGGQQRGQGV